MSKDTYSDDKKIEGYKGIDIEANNNINIVSADNISVRSEDALVLNCSLGNAGLSGQSVSITSGSSTNMSSAGPINTACTDYTLTAVNYVGVFDTVDIAADHDIRIEADESIVLRGDDTATLYSPVLVTVGGGSGSAQTDVVHLQGRDIFVDGSSTTQTHFIVKGANAKLIADQDHDGLDTYGDYYFVCKKELNSGYIAYIGNTANTISGDAGDILKLDFPNMTSEGAQRSTYIRFEYGSNDRAGSIYLGASDVAAFRGYESGSSTSDSNADGVGGFGAVSTYPADSGVIYATGNRDFAEWIECGDIEEWSEYVDTSVAKKDLPNEKHTTYLGLPEGFLAYVRSGAFWKNGPGLPMLVTKSAAMLGNSPENNTTFIGETFSFIGQINVFVKGQASSGDYIIPENNYCIAISQESANFEDYKKALGTCISEKSSDSLGQVLCAVGKK